MWKALPHVCLAFIFEGRSCQKEILFLLMEVLRYVLALYILLPLNSEAKGFPLCFHAAGEYFKFQPHFDFFIPLFR